MTEAGQLEQEKLEELSDDQVLGLLMSLRGIGRWTAEYVLLRSLGRRGVFPGDDVGARNRLAQWLGRDEPMDYEAVRHAVR
jgi:DNA-3-methyladenine glycosylase II